MFEESGKAIGDNMNNLRRGSSRTFWNKNGKNLNKKLMSLKQTVHKYVKRPAQLHRPNRIQEGLST